MSHLQKRLHLFRYRAFRWYLASCIFATLAGGFTYICLTWMIVIQDSSVGAAAIGMLTFFIPGVVLGPFMGVIVDRIPYRNHILALSNWGRTITILLFLWYSHYFGLSINAIYLLGLITGAFFSIYMPAMFRLTREMIPESELLYANATIDMVFEVGNVAGMGLAGIFISWFSMDGTLLVSVVLFACGAIALMCIRRKDLTISDNGKLQRFNIIKDFISGLKYVASSRILLIIYIIQLLLFIQYLTAPALLAPYAHNILHADVAHFGFIEMCLSIGAVMGGLFMPWLADRFGLMRVVLIASSTLGVCYILFSYNHVLWIAESIYFILGVCFASWPLVITHAQHITDINYQGRVQSCFNSVSGLALSLIYLGVDLGGSIISTHMLYWLEALFTLITLWLILLNWRQQQPATKLE